MEWEWKNKARRLILIDGEITAHTGIVGTPPKLPEKAEEWADYEAKQAAAFCYKQLATRNYPSAILRRKLKERYVSIEAIEAALEAISPYLDDEGWIQRFIEREARKGRNAYVIRGKLLAKGIEVDEDVVNRYI